MISLLISLVIEPFDRLDSKSSIVFMKQIDRQQRS